VPLLERGFNLADELARRDPKDYTSRSYVSMTGTELADLLRENEPKRALGIYDHTLSRLGEVKDNPKARRNEVWALTGSSYALRRLGRRDEARQRIDAACALLRDLKDYPAATVTMTEGPEGALRALADHYADTGNTAAAIATYEELLEKVRAANPQPQTDLRHAHGLSRIYRDLGNLHRRAGHKDQAQVLDQQRLELWQYWDKKLPDNTFVRRQLAGARSH